jgi:uncharacterized protein (DUF2147 family)
MKIKTLFATTLACTLACAALYAGAASAAEPYGTWVRPSTGTQVHFYDCGGKLCGKITAVKDVSRKSEIGSLIVPGAKKTGDNKWEGDLIDVSAGKTYSGAMTLEGPNAFNLKGCVAMVLCSSETWTKVK